MGLIKTVKTMFKGAIGGGGAASFTTVSQYLERQKEFLKKRKYHLCRGSDGKLDEECASTRDTKWQIKMDMTNIASDLAMMGVNNEDDTKQLMNSFLDDLQDDLDKDIIDMMRKATQTAGLGWKKTGDNDDAGGVSGASSIHGFELTREYPLYIGASGQGDIMTALNEASVVSKEFVRFILKVIDNFKISYKDVVFRLTVPLSSGHERTFEGKVMDIFYRELEVPPVVKRLGSKPDTCLWIRVCIQTAVEDYLNEIDQAGWFYLMGYMDIDNSDKTIYDLEVKGLGFVNRRDISPHPAGSLLKSQLLLGEDVL